MTEYVLGIPIIVSIAIAGAYKTIPLRKSNWRMKINEPPHRTTIESYRNSKYYREQNEFISKSYFWIYSCLKDTL